MVSFASSRFPSALIFVVNGVMMRSNKNSNLHSLHNSWSKTYEQKTYPTQSYRIQRKDEQGIQQKEAAPIIRYTRRKLLLSQTDEQKNTDGFSPA
jgi:hypothetical protein